MLLKAYQFSHIPYPADIAVKGYSSLTVFFERYHLLLQEVFNALQKHVEIDGLAKMIEEYAEEPGLDKVNDWRILRFSPGFVTGATGAVAAGSSSNSSSSAAGTSLYSASCSNFSSQSIGSSSSSSMGSSSSSSMSSAISSSVGSSSASSSSSASASSSASVSSASSPVSSAAAAAAAIAAGNDERLSCSLAGSSSASSPSL